MLLGVLGIYSPAEIIPYEPDMYNNSAGKRYGIHCLWEAWTKPSSLGYIMTIKDNEDHAFYPLSYRQLQTAVHYAL